MNNHGRTRRRWQRASLFGLGAVVALCSLGALSEWALERRDRARFPPPHALVDLGGRGLYLTCRGEGTPTIVLEAGGPGDSRDYDALMPRLAEISRVCAYDRAGLGWSDESPVPATAGALADDLAALLERAGLPPPYVLVASSAGGLTVHLYAQRHRGAVVGMVLLDVLTGDMITRAPAEANRLIRRACVARLLAPIGLLRLLDPFHLRQSSSARGGRDLAFASRRSTWDTVCSMLSSGAESAAQLALAPPLDAAMPLVVMRHDRLGDTSHGGVAEDAAIEPMWRAAQASLAAESTRGELIVATGSGHHIRDERPDLVVAAIERLIGEARSLHF